MAVCNAMADTDAAQYFENKPWGFATVSDEAGTTYNLNGGGIYGYDNAKQVTLKALGSGQTDDKQILNAIALYDVIILDGSNGDFTIASQMKITSCKNKTIVGINNARLCTEFYLTASDIAYLKQQGLDGLSSSNQVTGTLPDGTTLTCDERAFYTKKAMMELEYQKRGVYELRNGSGIFSLDSSDENIIIRNISLIGPGAVDIDAVDLISNTEAKHIWIDHCYFQDSMDGALDSKRCDYCTYTWNYFCYTDRSFSHAYTNGCGWAEGSMMLHLTFGCNEWGPGCVRRLPQCGDCYVHLVNNYHNCPGNSVGMTLNDNCRSIVEGCYAAAGVNLPLTGSGSQRYILARNNNFSYASTDQTVTMPYQYTTFDYTLVPAVLEGTHGAGAKLDNDQVLPEVVSVEKPAETTSMYFYNEGLLEEDNKLAYADGATLVFPYTEGKAYSNGVSITTPDDTYTSIKVSNGKTNTFTCPDGKYATKAVIYCYYNAKDANQDFTKYPATGFRTTYWKSVNGVTYTEDNAHIILSRSGDDPEVCEFNLGGVASFDFTNTGEQVCFVLAVTYGEPDGISTISTTAATTDGACYNLAGQRVSASHKGLVIKAGKKYILK